MPPIAIVGAALRFPGATDPASFHELTVTGRRMFRDITQATATPDPGSARASTPRQPTVSHHVRAALLASAPPTDRETPASASAGTPACEGTAPDQGPAPDQATAAETAIAVEQEPQPQDPQDGRTASRYRLAAETAMAALKDIPPAGRLSPPGRIGVIIANAPDPDTIAPDVPDVASWVYGRLGLDPAAASPPPPCSLRAIASACDKLAAGEFDLVLAGGVSTGIETAWLAAGAPAGEDVRVYDISPTGTLPGEGCGVIALMRTATARAGGLPVYAEIVGWQATDQAERQTAAIHGAYLRAGADPADVQLIEGHGAATAVDDIAELTALLEVLAPGLPASRGQCAIGAVSANIGDTRSAAGVAAVLKTALAMTAGVIPPTTGCIQPNQLLRTGSTPFRIVTEPEPWPETRVRLAAVNSLGTAFPGVSRTGPVHLVLRRERDPGRPAGRRRRAVLLRDPDAGAIERGDADLQISRQPACVGTPDGTAPEGRTPDDTAPSGTAPSEPTGSEPTGSETARADVLTNEAGPGDMRSDDTAPDGLDNPVPEDPVSGPLPLRRAPRTRPNQIMRPNQAIRQAQAETVVAVSGADRSDLAVTLDTIAITAAQLSGAGLREFARELAATPAGPSLPVRAAILAADPGQLAQRATNAAAILRTAGPEPVRAWPRPGTSMAGAGFYLSEGTRGRVALLFPGLASTAVEHSAVLSASMATLAAAERLGIQPAVAVGYSFGEITGLAWAGAITFGEAARFAAHRAEIISASPGRAAMARVFAGPAAVARLSEGTGLVVAAQEGPAQHVIAGSMADIRDLPQRATALGTNVDVMSVAHALHSPAMLSSVAPMRAAAGGLRFTAPRRRLVSTITGLDVTGDDDVAELIAGQLTRPALLAGALALACAEADLIMLTARDPALARAAAGAHGHVPVVQAPIEACYGTAMPALAAFFATRAVDDLRPYLSADAEGRTRDRSEKKNQEGELAARA